MGTANSPPPGAPGAPLPLRGPPGVRRGASAAARPLRYRQAAPGAAGSGEGAEPAAPPGAGSAGSGAGPGRAGRRLPAGHAAQAPAAPDLYLPVAQVWALPLPRGPRPHDRLRLAVRGGQYGVAPARRGCPPCRSCLPPSVPSRAVSARQAQPRGCTAPRGFAAVVPRGSRVLVVSREQRDPSAGSLRMTGPAHRAAMCPVRAVPSGAAAGPPCPRERAVSARVPERSRSRCPGRTCWAAGSVGDGSARVSPRR